MFSKHAHEFLEKNFDSRIHITWVPGHKGIEINKLADREAKWGCCREDSIQVSLSYYKERATKLVLRGWRKDYQVRAFCSTFWHSTTCPPNTKPSKTFTQLKDSPEVFTQLTQLRTMHRYNTYYYSCFNITNRDWDCKCGDATPPNPTTVREHILHLCPLLADEHREFLTPVSSLHETLTLLGSDKGLLATAKFLKESGALTSNCRPYRPPDMPYIPAEVDIADITDEKAPD